jgi:predicted RNA polymerase sigma factor
MEGAARAMEAVEAVARTAYGRLVAFLAARNRDIAGAEDALADAFAAALHAWPRDGVPDRPEAWLLTAARRRLADRARHRHVQAASATALVAQAEARAAPPTALAADFPDERLALLFVCAHPAIDPASHTPLMLQCVLGLDAARIAAAFLATPAAIGQRLARAKAKIRTAAIRFAVPEPEALASRLPPVLEAIYAAFAAGWDDWSGADPRRRGLAQEAIFLGRLLVAHLPEAAEARGLLALMLLAAARHPARRDAEGRFVPLADQDPARWQAPMIAEGMRHLQTAARAATATPGATLGRFQLEAAIQAVHCVRPTDWREIALLYEGLVAHAPTLGMHVGRAAAVGEALGPARGLALLDALERTEDYQPYWAVRAHLLAALGHDAMPAARRAIALADDEAVRTWLAARYRIA